MVLIGILGNKGNGKDTIADYIVHKYNFEKYAIAKPLKDICKILFNFSNEQLYGDLKEEKDSYWKITPRHAMEFIGTDLIRHQFDQLIPNLKNSFWLQHFKLVYDNSLKNKNIVISDIRFQNEVDMIHQLNGIIIKVIRPSVKQEFTHIAEEGIKKIHTYDYFIENSSTIPKLHINIDYVINNILSKNI